MDRDDAILMAYVVAQAAVTQGGDFSERFQTSLRAKGFVVAEQKTLQAAEAREREATELLLWSRDELSACSPDASREIIARIDAFLKGEK